MMPLLFGTRNPGKLAELRRLVARLPLEVLSPDEVGRQLPEVEEDGATFAQNAEKKASAYALGAGLHALADDSGICVDAVQGLPGIRSARWSEPEAPGLSGRGRDEANNAKLLRELQGVEGAKRGAEYRAVLALAAPDGTILATVTGACRGWIAEAPRGASGFGYDPLFIPRAWPDRTMAELPPGEKDALSHRGEAFRKMLPHLQRLAGTGG
jgi:XTP/dITP diphosphohydrolase